MLPLLNEAIRPLIQGFTPAEIALYCDLFEERQVDPFKSVYHFFYNGDEMAVITITNIQNGTSFQRLEVEYV